MADVDWIWLDEAAALLRDPPSAGGAGVLADRWRTRHVGIGEFAGLGLRFHQSSARNRRQGFVRRRFGRLLSALGQESSHHLLHKWLLRQPGPAADWADDLCGMVELVAEEVQAERLPLQALELAEHEQRLAEVRRTLTALEPAEGLDALAPNPTLMVREVRYDWPRWLRASKPSGWPEPVASPVIIGYYRHPVTGVGRWRELDPQVLACLQIVMDEVALPVAASVARVEVEIVQSWLQNLINDGLLCSAVSEAPCRI